MSNRLTPRRLTDSRGEMCGVGRTDYKGRQRWAIHELFVRG